MADREPTGKMIAEVMREVGLLVLTFIPVDAVIEQKPLQPYTFWSAMVIGFLLVLWGIAIERVRR